MIIKRGDIVLVDLDPSFGCEQGSKRPVLIIQNDIGNQYSPVTIIAPITSKIFEIVYPTNLFISSHDSNLNKDSTILFNQIKTIDKKRIIKKVGKINSKLLEKVDRALIVSLGIGNSNLKYL